MCAYQIVKRWPVETSQKRRSGGIWRRFLRCARGVTAIEFAFAAPVIAMAAAAVIELSLMMFVSTLSEGALREASRFSITGFVPSGMTREERPVEILEEHTIGLVDMDQATVTYHVYPSFDDIGKPEPYTDNSSANGNYDAGEAYQDINGNGQWDSDMGAAGLGGPGDIVLYTIEYDWEIMTPLMTPLVGNGGKVRMKSSVAVRNEPFDPVLAAAGGGG